MCHQRLDMFGFESLGSELSIAQLMQGVGRLLQDGLPSRPGRMRPVVFALKDQSLQPVIEISHALLPTLEQHGWPSSKRPVLMWLSAAAIGIPAANPSRFSPLPDRIYCEYHHRSVSFLALTVAVASGGPARQETSRKRFLIAWSLQAEARSLVGRGYLIAVWAMPGPAVFCIFGAAPIVL